MGKKIFISYKYADSKVKNLTGMYDTRVRDYVDIIQDKIGKEHINKGEKDGEDLSNFKDSTIASKLRDKIYDSSVTIVLISKGMKEEFVDERDQWIPWEISYSLREYDRNGRKSRANAILAVVIPDEKGEYSYYIEDKMCCLGGCRLLKTDTLFSIIRKNMFNIKEPEFKECAINDNIYLNEVSYIKSVKWDDFITNYNKYINEAIEINNNRELYEIYKNIV